MSAVLAQVLISASVMGVLLGRFFKTLVARDLPAFLGNILNVRASVAYQRETVVRENEERGREEEGTGEAEACFPRQCLECENPCCLSMRNRSERK